MIMSEKQYTEWCTEQRTKFKGHISFMTYDEYFDSELDAIGEKELLRRLDQIENKLRNNE